MLEGLDSIDWAHIHHSHGTAESFPRWIRELRSDDPEVRKNVRDNLFEYSNHQGTIYPVSSYLVPFLIELVNEPDTLERSSLLYHLQHLAQGCFTDLTYRFGSPEQMTYDALEAGADVYLALLGDSDEEVRFAAFNLVTALCWPGPRADRAGYLADAASREQNADKLAAMLRLLLDYGTSGPNWERSGDAGQAGVNILGFAMSRLIPIYSANVRFRAALASVVLHGGTPPVFADVIPEILSHALTNPEDCGSGETAFGAGRIMRLAIQALEHMPRSIRLSILGDALASARYAQDAHLLGGALLENIFWGNIRPEAPGVTSFDQLPRPFMAQTQLQTNNYADQPDNRQALFRPDIGSGRDPRDTGQRYFYRAPPADLTALSAEERRLIRLVLDTDLVWMVHSNLLEAYGLPVHRDEARALLDAADASAAKKA